MPDALHNGDSVYRMLFDEAGDAIFVHTGEKILAVNGKACEMLGYTEDELLSMRPNEVNATEHRVYMPEHLAKLKKRKTISFETIHQKKDGSALPVEITARAIAWNGEPAVMSICRDNSVKNHYDRVVLAAAMEWQNTFDAIDDAVFLLSPDDRILRCNKASYRMFEKSKPGEVLGKLCWEIVHGTSSPIPSCPIIRMRKTKKRESSVVKSGERWFEVTVDPVLDGNNNISAIVHVVSDVTERRQAEEALRESRELFSLFIRHSPVYSYIKDVTPAGSRVLLASDNFQQMIGIPGADMQGKAMEELFPADTAAKITADDLAVVTGGEVLMVEEDLNGRNYSSIKFPIVLGGKTLLAGYTMDITERRQAEAALRLKNQVFDVSIAANSIADNDGIITEVNDAFLRIWGYPSKKEVVGKPILHFLNDSKMALAIVTALNEAGRWEGDYIARRRDGSTFTAHGIATVLRDENGKLMGYQSAVMDITERKLAEAELLKIQKQYRDLVESTSDLVTRVDVNGHFLFMNHTARKIYGFVSEDCVGRLAFDFIHPEDRAATEVAFQAWLKSGMEEFKFENRMVDISGQIHYMEWLIRSEHDENGNVKGFASTARDISDRKNAEAEKVKLEEQARQLQKTESLGRMSGAIAHHFNNQLQVVMGYLEMVIGDLPLSSPSIVNLTIAMQATKKASEVSGLLLSYLGQKPVKLESLDLTELCHTILPVLQAGMPKDIVMETDLPSPGPFISADAKQIRQLLTNLAINAWEAIGDKAGIIRIAVRTVSSRDIPASHRFPVQWCPLEQQYVCLEVRDSGCGIEEKDIENLFDPFFSTKFTGRGLGLSVVLGIVRAHSIAITVESGIGGGSVFRVFFSLSPQPPERRIPKVPNIIFGDTVLLVEDNNAVREVTRIVLVDLGFTVFQARDGVEAVEIFEQHKDEISWLFCDLTMPRMGGWETIFAIRTIRHDLPVVLASGYDDVRAMNGEHSELPDFFLQKPYDMNKLCEMTGRSMGITDR